MKKTLKYSLFILLPLMFVGNSHLCDFLYEPGCLEWWKLRTNIYSLMFAGFFWLVLTEIKENLFRFIFSVAVGLSISDVVDRIFFNTREFTKEDILMMAVTLIICSIEYYVRQRRRDTQA